MTKFIITQYENRIVTHLRDFDVLISEEDETICSFNSYEEAAAYLLDEGVPFVNGRFLNNVAIERLQ